MKKCKACGREISETAPFCKYCGAKVENEPEAAVPHDEKKARMEAFTLELRELCDRMTAYYVDAYVDLEREGEGLRQKLPDLENQLQKCREELEKSQAENRALQEKLEESGRMIARLAAEKEELERENAELTAWFERESDENVTVPEVRRCPKCGADLEADAVFCGNCGARL